MTDTSDLIARLRQYAAGETSGSWRAQVFHEAADEIAELRSALASARDEGLGAGWRPMDSAPLDGTRILCGDWDDGVFRQFVCHWDEGWPASTGLGEQPPFWLGNCCVQRPTAWRALPAPPAVEEE